MKGQWLMLLLIGLPIIGEAQSTYNLKDLSRPLILGSNDVLWYEDRYLEVLGPNEVELTHTYAITLLNEVSEADEQAILYSTETAQVLEAEARVLDRKGNEVQRVKKEEMKDLLPSGIAQELDDNRALVASLPYHDYPYTVEVKYRMRISGPGVLQAYNWMILDRPQRSLRYASYQVEVPNTIEVSFLPVNIELAPEKEILEETTLYRFIVSDFPALESEYKMPSAASFLPRLYLFPNRFELEGYQGSMESWETYGQFMYQWLAGKRSIPNELADEVAASIEGAGTSRQKIDRLYRFMQDEISFESIQFGLGGWQLMSIEEVYSKKYGDSKALTNLMMGMLELVGIESFPVLIYQARQPFSDLHEEVPTIDFNHMLLYVPEENFFLECTSNDYPAGFIGQSNEGRQALLLTPQGGKVIEMPRTQAKDNRMVHRATVVLNVHGGARVRMEKEVSGLTHEYYRNLKSTLEEAELKQQLKSNLNLPTHTWEDWSLAISREQPQADLRIRMNFLRLGNEAGKRLFLPLNFLNPPPSIPPIDANREYVLERRMGYSEMDTIEFLLPPGYGIEAYPEESIRVESEFGSYKATVEWKGDRLWYIRELIVEPYQIPPEKYQDFRTFFLKVQQADRQQFVLVKRI